MSIRIILHVYQKLRSWVRFETEAWDNSEMAYDRSNLDVMSSNSTLHHLLKIGFVTLDPPHDSDKLRVLLKGFV